MRLINAGKSEVNSWILIVSTEQSGTAQAAKTMKVLTTLYVSVQDAHKHSIKAHLTSKYTLYSNHKIEPQDN